MNGEGIEDIMNWHNPDPFKKRNILKLIFDKLKKLFTIKKHKK